MDLLLQGELSRGYIINTKRKGRSLVAETIRVVLILIFAIIVFSGGLFIRTFLTRRAISKVIEIFYQHNALGVNGAKTLHELGLERPDFFQRMTRPRDYKQYALQILIKRGIIFEDGNGRLYMVEERLDQNLRSNRNDLLSHGRSS
jgi:hypothetical protein